MDMMLKLSRSKKQMELLPPTLMKRYQKVEIPVVTIGTTNLTLNDNLSYCDVNTKEICDIFITDMVKKGFKKPALLSYATPLTANNDRNIGFKESCKKNKLKYCIEIIELNDKNLVSKICNLIDQGFDSFILPSTNLYKYVRVAIKKKGLEIVKNIMVYSLGYGYENKNTLKQIKYAEANWPAIANASVKLLNQMLNNRKRDNYIIIKNKINN